jgi:hypothetical protein
MSPVRILRSGPGDDVVRSPYIRQPDPRQAAFDLDLPQESTAEETIYRLTYELTKLRSRLAKSGRSPISHPGDEIAAQADRFARALGTVEESGGDTEADADAVNARIAMVAEEADALIAALIEDAEAHGLEATGPWLKIPLVECQAFEAPEQGDADAARADDIRDQSLNS